MITVVLQCLSLALASLTPTMVVLVAALLPTSRGPAKALAVVLGRYLAHFVIAGSFVFLIHTQTEQTTFTETHETLATTLFVVTGIVLLVAAGRLIFSDSDEDVTDRPPSRLSEMLHSVSPVMLAVVNALIVLFSLRLMAVAAAGAAVIVAADLNNGEELIATAVLAASMVFFIAVPLLIYFGLGRRGPVLVERMGDWMKLNQRVIQIAVLSFFGGALLVKGLAL